MELTIYTGSRRYEALDRLWESLVSSDLYHRTSELNTLAGISDPNEIERAIERALRVCRAGHIPVESNFRRIFTGSGHELMYEWLLSDLAVRLVILNADPIHPVVAQAQLLLTKSLTDVKIQ